MLDEVANDLAQRHRLLQLDDTATARWLRNRRHQRGDEEPRQANHDEDQLPVADGHPDDGNDHMVDP